MTMYEQSQENDLEVTGSGQLTLFLGDSRASHLVLLGSEEAKQMTVTSGRKCLELYEKSSPLGLLVKMLLTSSTWNSNARLLTWKVKVTKHKRLLFQLAVSVPRTKEKGVLLWGTPASADCQGSHGGGQGRSLRTDIHNWKKAQWPTPTASDATAGAIIGKEDTFRETSGLPRKVNKNGTDGSVGLGRLVKLWPTTKASEYKGCGPHGSQSHSHDTQKHNLKGFVMEPNNSGQLNPAWVECLMGFPLGWTDPDCDKPQPCSGVPAGPGEEQHEWEPLRVATGVPKRAARIKALGNAVVPAQAYPLFAAIMQVENEKGEDE